jgi:hypothetical protein
MVESVFVGFFLVLGSFGLGFWRWVVLEALDRKASRR